MKTIKPSNIYIYIYISNPFFGAFFKRMYGKIGKLIGGAVNARYFKCSKL